MAITRNKMSTF